MIFFGIHLYAGTYRDFFDMIFHVEKPTLVFTPNPEILYRAYHDETFLRVLEKADYNAPDGNGLYVGSIMMEGKGFLSACLELMCHKKQVIEKYGQLIKGSDLVKDIFESCHASPKRILIIDRKNTHPKNELEHKKARVQKDLKNILERKYPGSTLFVTFDGEETPEMLAQLIEKENIDFVFSCIGMKRQEERLVEIFHHLREDRKVVGLGVGASIDFLLGLQKRAPKIFRDAGLEWLYRLIREPRIRYKRIYTALVEFPRLVKISGKISR